MRQSQLQPILLKAMGARSTGYFMPFRRVALGSTREYETHVIIARHVALFDANAADELLTTCEKNSKMLRSLISAIEQRPYKSSKSEPT